MTDKGKCVKVLKPHCRAGRGKQMAPHHMPIIPTKRHSNSFLLSFPFTHQWTSMFDNTVWEFPVHWAGFLHLRSGFHLNVLLPTANGSQGDRWKWEPPGTAPHTGGSGRNKLENWMQVEVKVLGLAGKQCPQAPTATMLSSLPLLSPELAMCEECTQGCALQVSGTSGLR